MTFLYFYQGSQEAKVTKGPDFLNQVLYFGFIFKPAGIRYLFHPQLTFYGTDQLVVKNAFISNSNNKIWEEAH